ncbi:hypothetical protein ASZ78_013235, partial [Callipepla squamata]
SLTELNTCVQNVLKTKTLFSFLLVLKHNTYDLSKFYIFLPPTFLVACVNTKRYIYKILTYFSGAVAVISTDALMEQLYLKYQQRPWTETLKLVHFCMVRIADETALLETATIIAYLCKKRWVFLCLLFSQTCQDKPRRSPVSNAPDGPLLLCMEKLQRTLNDKSLFSVMNRLESLSKQKGLNSHVSPSGTVCYITSNMFYIEVQLEKDGRVMDAKLAHLGEAPVVCDDVVQHLRSFYRKVLNCIRFCTKNSLPCHLMRWIAIGFSIVRMKNYDAFGKILEGLSNLYQIPGNSEMKAKGYLALQSLEKDLYALSLLDRTQDVNRVTEVLHGKVGHLVPRTGGTPMNIEFYISPYQILEAELNPVIILKANEKCHLVAGIQITALKLAPLYELIIQSTLKEKCSEDLSIRKSRFFVSLPDCPKHCYFINMGSEKSNLAGALVSKIPFTHPKCVPAVIEILRHQMAYNSLISSCVSDRHLDEGILFLDDSELLYFEVAPHKNTSFSVFFVHPMRENLACVMIDVITSREVQCSLHLHPQDPPLNSSDGFISRSVKRCMSVPVVMRAIFRNALKVEAGSETQGAQADAKQKPESPCEQAVDGLEGSLSVSGQQDLVKADKQGGPDSPEQRLTTAQLEALGDEMEKSNTIVNIKTSSRVEESNSAASTEAALKDK